MSELSVAYRAAAPVLHRVSLRAPAGAITAVLGRNGAGKSTLLRAIGGLLPATGGRILGGSIRAFGEELAGCSADAVVQRGLAQVMEGRRILGDLTVEDNLRAGGYRRAGIDAAIDDVYRRFPLLGERRRQLAGTLSGGEQQMLAIARALMARPKLLLVDEPSLGLAPRAVSKVAELLRDIHQDGVTVLLVEQKARMALELCSCAYLLERGRVVELGDLDQVASGDELRDLYLGDAEASHPRVVRSKASAHLRRGESESVPPWRVRAPGVGDRPQSRADAVPGAELRVEGVTLDIGGVRALDDVSLEVGPGELAAVIGPNGAGKTSLFNCISGLYRPTRGGVALDGRELGGLAPHAIARLGVARVFQHPVLFESLSVVENLQVGADARRRSSRGPSLLADVLALPGSRANERASRHRADEMVALLNLDEHRDTPVSGLPYGVRKRVELGRALSTGPRLLLLDEPAAGLDRAEIAEMAALLHRVRDQLRVTQILIEHELGFVVDLASRITVLDFGAVIARGGPREIPRDRAVIEAYLGT